MALAARRFWVLFSAFLLAAVALAAALNFMHVRAGFLTSYLADLTLPALLYVYCRGLAGHRPRNPVTGWLGQTPQRAAAILFLSSTATEISQYFWPHGVFAGHFDPGDIAAYGAGLAFCYFAEKRFPVIHESSWSNAGRNDEFGARSS